VSATDTAGKPLPIRERFFCGAPGMARSAAQALSGQPWWLAGWLGGESPLRTL